MFGAVEEKAGAHFPGGAVVREFPTRVSLSMLRAVFLLDSKWEVESGGRGQDDFHRPCTGNAERQLPVPGSWFSVGFLPARKPGVGSSLATT
jgi:hypothetical protein